ncbi:MAG TPA: gliding motility-associated C-terminal domain-containing protein, partial [Chitinophaga sp.]
PSKPEENTPVRFVNESVGAISYHWDFGDGATSTETNPVHQYNKTGTYNACLIATNQFGCTDTLCQEVAAIVVPLFDVPSAFSPNKDGMNDVLLVRGFGIARLNLKIFNRWGQLVFESNDPSLGWDGRFKGNLQPMDAYAYSIYIEFSDGTKANKTGSITLLR